MHTWLTGIWGEVLSFAILLLPPIVLLWMHNRKAEKKNEDLAARQPEDM